MRPRKWTLRYSDEDEIIHVISSRERRHGRKCYWNTFAGLRVLYCYSRSLLDFVIDVTRKQCVDSHYDINNKVAYDVVVLSFTDESRSVSRSFLRPQRTNFFFGSCNALNGRDSTTGSLPNARNCRVRWKPVCSVSELWKVVANLCVLVR